MRRFTDYLSQDFLGGPRPWKFAWVINFQKTGTFFFLGALMWWYGQSSAAAWVYLALHGTYGLVWLVKDMALPDPNWQIRITIGGIVMTSKLIDGTFPDYQRVIPAGNDKRLTVDKGDFAASVDRVSTIASEKTR